MRRRAAAWAILAFAAGLARGCGGAPVTTAASGREAGTAEERAGVRVSPLPAVEPRSAEAAAATKARGDAVFVVGETFFRGSTAGLVLGRIDPATGAWFEHAAVYLPGAAIDVAVHGAVAYVTLGPAGLAVIDVSDPVAPAPLALIEGPGSSGRLALDGERLAVAAGHAGVRLFDVSTPARPALLGAWRSEGYVRQAVLDGDRVLVAEGSAGISLLSVEPGGALGHRWRVATEGEVRAVAVRTAAGGGRTIVVADGPGGIAVLAARGDVLATEVSRLALPDMARDVAFDRSGNHVFVANGDRGVVTVDIRDPARPRVAGTLVTDKPANRLRLHGERLLVGNDSAGLLVLDAVEPAALSRVVPSPRDGEVLRP
jgi:hypothetical protein